MDFFPTSSQPQTMLYPTPDFHLSPDIRSYTQNTVFTAPESPMLTVWLRPLSRHDKNNDSVARPQLLLEPNKKRHINSVGESGGSSFPISSSKSLDLSRGLGTPSEKLLLLLVRSTSTIRLNSADPEAVLSVVRRGVPVRPIGPVP